MSKRGDYETEYENEAETLIADMSFTDDDPSVERGISFISFINEFSPVLCSSLWFFLSLCL